MNRNKKLLISEMDILGEELVCLEHHHVNAHNTHQMTETRDVTILTTKKENLIQVINLTLDRPITRIIQIDSCVKDLRPGSKRQVMILELVGHQLPRQINHRLNHLTRGENCKTQALEVTRIVTKNSIKFREPILSNLQPINPVHNYSSNKSSSICCKPLKLQTLIHRRSSN